MVRFSQPEEVATHVFGRIALLAALAVIGCSYLLIAPSKSFGSSTEFCNHRNEPQFAKAQCGPGPRHSLTYVEAVNTEAGGEGEVCADSENEDGSFNHYYCGWNFVNTGEYCGCQLRKGWDQNGNEYNLYMYGVEFY